MRIDNSWNQPDLSVGDTGDRTGPTIHMGDKPLESYGPAVEGDTPLQRLDGVAFRELQAGCTVEEAAIDLWLRENATLDLKDPLALAQLRERLRGGNLGLLPTQGELTGFLEGLRQNGLSGVMDWSALERALLSADGVAPEELGARIERLASRYVAARDKLERNVFGEELTAQRERLERAYQTGKTELIEGYTKSLQDSLGVSDGDAQVIRDSLEAIIQQKVDTYGGALKTVHQTVAEKGQDSQWLKNHDGYIAAKLRETEGTAAPRAGDTRYTLEDLRTAGKVSRFYQSELDSAARGSRNEATLAFGMAMADMKTETLISKGAVGKRMAALLRSCRQQLQEKALETVDKRLAHREETRLAGEPKGAFAPLDRGIFKGIYQSVMDAFLRNGGNGAEAIRAGAAYGKEATAQAHARNPEVFRWGDAMEQCWKNFFSAPEAREMSQLEQQVEKLMAQSGRTSKRGCSHYQSYANDWHDFMKTVGNRVNMKA